MPGCGRGGAAWLSEMEESGASSRGHSRKPRPRCTQDSGMYHFPFFAGQAAQLRIIRTTKLSEYGNNFTESEITFSLLLDRVARNGHEHIYCGGYHHQLDYSA